MASATSAPRSPPSASNSETSAAQPAIPLPTKVDAANNNGVHNVFEEKPGLTQCFEILDSKDYIEKYQKYEADYTRRSMAKYFSKKNIYGGNIFEEKLTIDDEIIMSSRWPCTRSFADPIQGVEDQSSNRSSPAAETTNISNGKHLLKRNS